ncbi:hypothetical protein Aperf_G00000053485 [Anoplocephala perfoliata]
MAACCCCCCKKDQPGVKENVDDKIIVTEPATEFEYIDEFLEPQTSKEMSEAESSLETPPLEMEVQESVPPPQIQEEEIQPPKFGYWNIRGLPYWIEGDLRLSGTANIMERIAEKHHMLSDNEEERENLRKVNEEINALRTDVEEFSIDEDWESKVSLFLQRIASKLYRLSTTLGNKNWISGKKLNYPDFNLYDLLDVLRTLSSEALENFDMLRNFMLRFEGLKNVKAYIRTDEFRQRPFFSPKAVWNATKT